MRFTIINSDFIPVSPLNLICENNPTKQITWTFRKFLINLKIQINHFAEFCFCLSQIAS